MRNVHARLDLETARDYRIFNSTAASVGLLAILTYHSFTFTAADSISGGFSGLVTLNLHRADTGEKVATTSRVGDGPYSFVWYDNTVEMYVECIDSIGQVGRSQNTLCS